MKRHVWTFCFLLLVTTAVFLIHWDYEGRQPAPPSYQALCSEGEMLQLQDALAYKVCGDAAQLQSLNRATAEAYSDLHDALQSEDHIEIIRRSVNYFTYVNMWMDEVKKVEVELGPENDPAVTEFESDYNDWKEGMFLFLRDDLQKRILEFEDLKNMLQRNRLREESMPKDWHNYITKAAALARPYFFKFRTPFSWGSELI